MKVRTLILGLMLSVFLSACQEEEILGPASLKSMVDKVELSVEGETKTFSIKATRDWTAAVSPQDSGFEVSPLSGNGSNQGQIITVKADENTGRARSAVLTFSAAGAQPVSVTLYQNGRKGDVLSVSELRSYEVGDNLPLGKLKVMLLSDYSFGNVSYNNLYVQDKTAGIMLRLESEHEFSKGDSLEVNLDGAVLSEYGKMLQIALSNDNVVKYDKGTPEAKTVTVEDFLASEYEAQYIAIPDIQVVAADLEKTFVSNEKSTEIGVESKTEAEKPGRTFFIYSYYKSGSNSNVLTTTSVPEGAGVLKGIASRYNDKFQLILTSLEDFEGMTGERFEPAPYVKIKKYSYAVGEAEGFIKVVVESNTVWTVSEEADWLSVSEIPAEGGNGEFKLSYTALGDLQSVREAEVTVACPNGSHTFTITQKKVEVTSIADFNSDLTDAGERYRLTGTISEWYETQAIKEAQSQSEGYFRIMDSEGNTALIYGCKASSESETNDFGTLEIGIGDKVTLEGEKTTFPNVRATQSYIISYEKTDGVNTISAALNAPLMTKLDLNGTVCAVSKSGFVLSDGTDAIYVYTESIPEVVVGDKVGVKGYKDSYGGLPEVMGTKMEKTGTESVVHGEPVAEITSADALNAYYADWDVIEYVKITGKASWDRENSRLYLTFEGTDKNVVPYSPAEDYSRYDGLDITLYGYSASVYGETGSLQVVVDRIVAPAYISLSNTEFSVSAAATFAGFVVKSNVSWSVTADAEWIKTYTQAGEGDGMIEVSFDKNTSENDRSATFTIRAEGLADVVATLIQYKSGTTGVYQLVTSLSDITDGEYVIGFYHDTDGKYYALKNTAISENPTGVEITPSENTLSDLSDEYVWLFIGDNTNGFVVSASSNYLNSKDASQGISVGSDSTHKWKIISGSSYGFMMLNDAVSTDRYLVAYSSKTAGVSFRYYQKGSSYKGKLQLFKFTLQ